jgi:predicted signal transduction protein with EAL and GGDEF domain
LRETIVELTSALEAPYLVDGHTALVSMRFGTASGAGGLGGAQLLRFADIALARAVATKARHVEFTPDMQAGIGERQALDVEMRRSLKKEDFFLVYQPQVSLSTGEIVGVEALVRWQHPKLGIVSPALFIPLAEETGAIVELGEYLLQRACQEAATWDWAGRLAVNVSAVQFRLGDVVEAVERALRTSRLPSHRLDIEITESLFVDGAETVLRALETLRKMGVGVAIDDFGTGYSSLSYLTRLPIDKL